MEETKENVPIKKEYKKVNLSISLNPWMFSTIILAIVVIALLVFMFRGGLSGNVVSNTNNAATAAASASASAAATPADVPKTDEPVLEAFVFSYCPYGVQVEKAMTTVYDLLKDKAKIDLVYIGAMHGEYEKVESYRQICVEKIYGTDKLWAYLNEFNMNTDIGKCKGNVDCVTPLLGKIYSNNKFDKAKIDDCMKKDAEKLYNADLARAKELGISGSPTFVVNGVKVKIASRSPKSIEDTLCGAFNKAPSACSTALSTTAASAGFGAGSSTSSSSCG